MGRVPTDHELMEEALQHLFNLAASAKRAGRLDLAEQHYRTWIELAPWDPDPKYGLATLLLSQGRYAEGWRLYEARRDIPKFGIAPPAAVRGARSSQG